MTDVAVRGACEVLVVGAGRAGNAAAQMLARACAAAAPACSKKRKTPHSS